MAAKTLDVAEFETILRDGATYKLVEFFKGTNEAERAVLAPTTVSWFKKNLSFQAWDDTTGERRHRAVLNALLVTASADQLAKQRYVYAWPNQFEFELLTELRPSALRNFGEVLIQQNVNYFATVHELLARGLCQVPESDAFVQGFIGLARLSMTAKTCWLSERLKSEPWIQEKIWRLFEVEGEGEHSLAAQDKFLPAAISWSENLKTLASTGELDRARLLNESLHALDRGFAQFRAGWFSRFHELLKPTIDERQERTKLYGRLIGSAIPPTVAFAMNALIEIDKHSALSTDFIADALPPAFTAKSKSTVTSAISLIAKAVKKDQSFGPIAFTLVLPALAHESPDVQGKALDFLEKSGGLADAELRADARGYIDLVSPSVRSRLSALVGESLSTPPRDGIAAVYQQNTAKSASPLDRTERVTSITAIDELIDAMAFCLEHPDESVEIERLIDGVSRLYAPNREQLVTKMKPVLKRAAALNDTNAAAAWWTDVRNLLAEFILNLDARKAAMTVFVGNADSEGRAREEISFHAQQMLPRLTAGVLLLHGRFNSVLATVAAGLSLPDFAAPTHRAGWIDPAEMVQRIELWNASSLKPSAYAQAVALCRLPLAHCELLAPVLAVRCEFTDAVQYAVGIKANMIGSNAHWRAADAYRNPPKFGSHVDFGDGRIFQQFDGAMIRWQGIMFPSIRELLFASSIRYTAMTVDYVDVPLRRTSAAYFSLLTDSSVAFGPMSWRTPAISLFAVDAELSGYGRDALISLIDRAELDIAALAAELGLLLYAERSNPPRLSAALADVARISALHANAVRQLLEMTLHGGENTPRNYAPVLELFNELLISEGARVEDDTTIAHLRSVKIQGKTKKLITAILSR